MSINRKIPQSVKTRRKIDEAVEKALADQHRVHFGIFEKKDKRVMELEKALEIAAQSVATLEKDRLKQVQRPPPPEITAGPSLRYSPTLETSIESTEDSGFFVANWRNGWKWISNWTLAGIAYVSVYGVPQEVIELLPVATQGKVTATLAVLGLIGRFINQTKPKPLPALVENEVGDDD